MNKIITMGILSLGMCLAASAQEKIGTDEAMKRDIKRPYHERVMENKNPEEIAKIKTERLDKELKFTDEQRAQIYAIQLEDARKSLEYRDQHKKLRESHRQEMKGSHEKLHKILTEEQKKALNEKFKTHRKRKMMHRRGKHLDAQPFDKVDQKHVTPSVRGVE